jgi:hypothetical protein
MSPYHKHCNCSYRPRSPPVASPRRNGSVLTHRGDGEISIKARDLEQPRRYPQTADHLHQHIVAAVPGEQFVQVVV